MNIAFDMTNPYLYGSTGIGTYSYSLISSLTDIYKKDNFYLTLRSSRIFKLLKNFKYFSKQKLKKDNVYHNIAFNNFVFPNKKIDIFHGNDTWIPSKLQKTKTILTIHDLCIYSHPEYLNTYYIKNQKKKLERLLNNSLVDNLIAVSKQTSDEIINIFPHYKNKITIIQEGVSKFWRPVSEKYFTENFNYFLFVSNIEPRKNFKTVLKAFQKLKNKSTKLVVVGDKNNFSVEDNNIIYLGYTQKDNIRKLYSHSLGLIYTSLYEGFGLPPFEALACNCPVIISKNIPSSEFLPEKYKVDPKSVDNIIDKINEFIITSKNDNLYLLVKDHTWDIVADKTYNIYKKIFTN